MGGNNIEFWAALVSYIAMVVGTGLTAIGLAVVLFGLMLRWV